jgi:hypothetical protein
MLHMGGFGNAAAPLYSYTSHSLFAGSAFYCPLAGLQPSRGFIEWDNPADLGHQRSQSIEIP